MSGGVVVTSDGGAVVTGGESVSLNCDYSSGSCTIGEVGVASGDDVESLNCDSSEMRLVFRQGVRLCGPIVTPTPPSVEQLVRLVTYQAVIRGCVIQL